MTSVKQSCSILIFPLGILILSSMSLAEPKQQSINFDIHNNRITTNSTTSFDKALQDFSLNLFMHTRKELKEEENLCVSPVAVWTLLSILLEGAEGSTRDELRRVLGYKPYSARNYFKDETAIRERFKNIKNALNFVTPSIEMECTDMIYLNIHGNELIPEYRRLINQEYNTMIQNVDFNNNKTSEDVNKYVEKKTRGRIPEIVQQDDLLNSQMVMLSAAFFEGQWKTPFDEKDTEVADFFNEQGERIGSVNMMVIESRLPYVRLDSLPAEIVKLPYGDGKRLSMLIIAPCNNEPLSRVLTRLQNVSIHEIITKMDASLKKYQYEVVVSMPRFNITTNVDMKKILQNMELSDMFNERANFNNIFRDSNSFVSKVIHKAQIEVTEKGTIAAAAVALEITDRSLPTHVYLNKPFLYLIVEHTTSSIVFIGSYSKPTLF